MLKSIRKQLNLLTYSWRAIGPARMARNSVRWWADPEARNSNSGFDERYGTDTNAGLTPREAAIPTDRRAGATMYLPTMDRDLEAMFAALEWPQAVVRQTTFVDLGSGKGRAVFLAAMRPFREVVGVELSPVLHAVAEQNLTIMQKSGALRAPVRLELQDAAQLDVPRGPLVVYLYHPFREKVAAAVIERVVTSLERDPRPAAILYCHPTLQPCLDPSVFGQRDAFRIAAEGARATRRFKIGWTIWVNEQGLVHMATEPVNDSTLDDTGTDRP